MESTADSIAPVYQLYAGFCRETTLHGLKHTVDERVHWCERVLWFILTISAFFGAIYCALSQWSRFNSEPVVVSLQRDYRSWWSNFPAVTACLVERVDPDKARMLIERHFNVTEESNPKQYGYYLGLVELVADVSFRSNLQNFWKYQSDTTLRDTDLLQLALSVHPAMMLKVMVSDSVKEVYWMPVMTEVGMCLTYNSHYARFQFMLDEEAWQDKELHRCHYHVGQCYVRIDSIDRAVRYFIHSPYEISTAISNPTGEVLPGEEMIIDYKTVEIRAAPSVRSLRPAQRRCRYPDEWISDKIKMANRATLRAWRASAATSRSSSTCLGTSPSAPAFLSVPSSTSILIQKRSLIVLPFGLDVGLLGIGAYYLTRLKKPQQSNVISIFGPDPASKEGELHPEKVVRCIAHRGAGLDAPENTLAAFKYCVERDCNFVELDVRSSRDGQLVLLHDQGLERLAGTSIPDVRVMDWDAIKNIDVGATHPNRQHFKEVHLCLLDDALDYLLDNNVRMIIDVKGEDKQVITGVLRTFSSRPQLYEYAAVTCFNPFVLYQIRKKDPKIVGAMSYRPYCFSAQEYDAENGPNKPRFGENLPVHALLRGADVLHALSWRWAARWCGVSAVLLHKDIVSGAEIQYWRSLGVRCAGWCVNRPLEKLYWRGVLRAPYLANTLLGEPDVEKKPSGRDADESDRAGPLVDKLLDQQRRVSSGQN